MSQKYDTIVVKVGTHVLTNSEGQLDEAVVQHLCSQLIQLRDQNVRVILVSSGAVAEGGSIVELPQKVEPVVRKQVLAAVGQSKLIQTYQQYLEQAEYVSAQILVTKEDFRTRRHYSNIRNCFAELLQQGILPIVNENDVVSVHELMFTDNDELAGLIASMMNADALVLLTHVDGVLDGSPDDPLSTVIETIDSRDDAWKKQIDPETSKRGRGGMRSKCAIGCKLALMGIATHIVNGRIENALLAVQEGENIGTTFITEKRAGSGKRWVGICEGQEKGVVYINDGAVQALLNKDKAASLLPVGIRSIEGDFRKGDIIKISGEDGEDIGMGMAQYDAEHARDLIGKQGEKPLVHYDYLFLSN